ncbi:MAG: neutral trehalase [Pseudomonadota bacterium]
MPTAGLYPFQWNWDSCLVALGWATFDPDRAWLEIEMLFRAQWANGRVPHIVFHRPDDGYFPGPDVWQAGEAIATSGITQPPIAATCVKLVLDQHPAGAERARALFPKLLAGHRWFHSERDPGHTGLVTTIHSWETGMDNSPAWDEALAAFEVAANLRPYTRRDTGHIDSAQRPSDRDYDRYMTLVELFRAHDYGPQAVEQSPFQIADATTNAIPLRADRDLLAMARQFDEPTAEIEGWIDRAEAAFTQFIHPETGLLHSVDRRRNALLGTATHAGFLAFWAGTAPSGLDRQLTAWLADAAYAVPSIRISDLSFDRVRYWRGPIWAIANFIIAKGLEASGKDDLARRLRQDTQRLIATSGFFEYFDPIDGKGLGGGGFSWTAAMWLVWARND